MLSVEEAVSIANRIRGTNGEYHFPIAESVGTLPEVMYVLKVSLQRYRKKVKEFGVIIQAIEEGK